MELNHKEMEEVPLKTTLQPSDQTDVSPDSTCIDVIPSRDLASSSRDRDRDRDHRRLAITSIICGLSCIGVVALINSVKAEMTRAVEGNTDRTQRYSQRAKKLAVLSIVVWVLILILTPALFALVSYLLTLID